MTAVVVVVVVLVVYGRESVRAAVLSHHGPTLESRIGLMLKDRAEESRGLGKFGVARGT